MDLDYFLIKNCLVFKNVEIDLRNPLTIIRGSNLDRGSNSQNGVGKSLAFSLFAGLVTGEQPWSQKAGSNKTVMGEKASFCAFMHDDKHTYALSYYNKGKGFNYKFVVDDKDKGVKGLTNQRQYMEKLVPITREQLFSTFYISSYRPSILLSGKSSQRSDTFEQLFDLKFYEEIGKIFSKKKFELDLAAKERSKLKEKNDDLASKKSKRDPKKIKEIISDLRDKSESIMKKLKKYNEESSTLATFVSLVDQLETELSPDKINKKLETLREECDQDKNKLKKLTRALGAKEEIEKSIKIRKQIKKELKSLQSHPVDVLENDLKVVEADLAEGESLIKEFNKNREYVNKYNKLIKDLSVKEHSKLRSIGVQTLSDLRHKLMGAIESLTGMLDKMSGIKGKKKCPTCDHPLDKHKVKDHLIDISNEISTKKDELEICKKNLFILKFEEKCPLLIDLNEAVIKESIEKHEKKIDSIRSLIKESTKYNQLTERLKELPKTKDVPEVDEEAITQLEKDFRKKQKEIVKLESDLKTHERIRKTGHDFKEAGSARATYKAKKAAAEELTPTLSKIQDKLSVLSMDYAEGKQTRKAFKELAREIEEIDHRLKDREIYIALAAAYSPKGLRLDHIRAIAQGYINNLNLYAAFMLKNPMKFSCNIEIGHFDILAERNGKVADINSLSGSESRQFLAISALALLDILPPSQKFNTIVFDEIESGLSKSERERYLNNFIPMVMEKIPQVVVITPQEKEIMHLPAAKELIFTHKNGETIIAKA